MCGIDYNIQTIETLYIVAIPTSLPFLLPHPLKFVIQQEWHTTIACYT